MSYQQVQLLVINDIYNHNSEPLDYDIFEEDVSVRCRAGYISNGIDPPSSISCSDDVFSMGGGYECQLPRNCSISEEGIQVGYLINLDNHILVLKLLNMGKIFQILHNRQMIL